MQRVLGLLEGKVKLLKRGGGGDEWRIKKKKDEQNWKKRS